MKHSERNVSRGHSSTELIRQDHTILQGSLLHLLKLEELAGLSNKPSMNFNESSATKGSATARLADFVTQIHTHHTQYIYKLKLKHISSGIKFNSEMKF